MNQAVSETVHAVAKVASSQWMGIALMSMIFIAVVVLAAAFISDEIKRRRETRFPPWYRC